MTIFNNREGRTVTFRAITNTTFQLSQANTVAGETVNKLSIRKVVWAGNCAILRGANVIFQFPLTSSGVLDLTGNGMTNNEFPTANVVIQVNDGTSFLMVECGKESTFTSTY